MSNAMNAAEMLKQARGWQTRAEALAALESAQERWRAAEKDRAVAVEKAFVAGLSLRTVAKAVDMSFSGVKSKYSTGGKS